MWTRIWAFLDLCFFGGASARPGALGATLRVLRYPYAVLRDLSRGEINLRAMGLVYTTLLSLIPLLAFSFAILKFFGGHRDLQPVVYEFFRPVGEAAAAELTSRVMQFANRVSSGVVGSVGLVVLAWTLIGTIKKVEDSFNFVWHVDQPRSFARRLAEYTTLLIAGPVLLVGFLGLTHAALSSAPVQEVVRLPLLQRLRGTSIVLAPYAMVTAFFTALYMMVPNTRVRWRAALTGALVAGVVWAAVGRMFTAFVVASTRLTIVYAGFAFIVAALLWTYFGWLILLAGELGLPGIAVAQMAGALERAGLLIVTESDEFLPARDTGAISVSEILDIARNQRSGHVAPRYVPVPPVDRLLASVEEARRSRCGELTLRDLIDEVPRTALISPRQSSSR